MKIWFDTVDLEVIADGVRRGLVAGVTTNPNILAPVKEVKRRLYELLQAQEGPVAVQVTSQNAEEMVKEGRKISEFSDRMVVKVPVNSEGLIAIKELREDKIPILATGIFDPLQALLASNLGATYITPYFSRMPDGKATLKQLSDLLKANHSPSKILVASVKELDHILFSAELGVHSVTIKEPLYRELIRNNVFLEEFTDKFTSDWKAHHGNQSIKDLLR